MNEQPVTVVDWTDELRVARVQQLKAEFARLKVALDEIREALIRAQLALAPFKPGDLVEARHPSGTRWHLAVIDTVGVRRTTVTGDPFYDYMVRFAATTDEPETDRVRVAAVRRTEGAHNA